MTDSDRLDNITAQYLDDPDAVLAHQRTPTAPMSPFDLTDEVGSTIDITLPQGIRGQAVLKGVYLSLFMGPMVPVPAPKAVVDH